MKKIILLWSALLLLCCSSCQRDLMEYGEGDLKISIEEGEHWQHDFPMFLGIKIKNSPQIAIWVEDTEGNYLSTVYASRKIATQSWQGDGDVRRKEALPAWCYSRGVQYADGLYVPTKDEPLTDGISGATPQAGFDIKLHPTEQLKHFVVKIELNHSVDFNDYYTDSAEEGEANYSGGKEGGSGQPAVVYAAEVDLASGATSFEAILIGHSSPDGSSGDIDPDTSKLTTALRIVKRIMVTIQ